MMNYFGGDEASENIQKYDFDVYHIPGPDKIAGDAFSRLMDPSDQETALPLTRSQAMNEMEQSAEARDDRITTNGQYQDAFFELRTVRSYREIL